MDSELQDALDRLLDATANWTLSASPLAAGEVAAIVEAARKVANPDIEAAVEIIGQLRFAKTADDWDDMIYDVTKEAVEAALGITEDK